MTRLSDTQLVILKAAVGREDRMVLPLPSNIKGGAAQKTIGSMLKAALIQERRATVSDLVWRSADDHDVTLVATDAAFEALGADPNEGEEASGPDAADTGRRGRRQRAGGPGGDRRCHRADRDAHGHV